MFLLRGFHCHFVLTIRNSRRPAAGVIKIVVLPYFDRMRFRKTSSSRS